MDLAAIQKALVEQELDGWLLYDFRGSNPIARAVIGFDESQIGTRRWFYLIPREGQPVAILHAIEPHALRGAPGPSVLYRSWKDLEFLLEKHLAGMKRVAMEYSPRAAIPYVSRVDAGTIEMVRTAGAQVVSSADLVQHFEARWTPEGLASHRRAAAGLKEVLQAAFDHVTRGVGGKGSITEHSVQRFMMEQFRSRGLFCEPPIVAVNANAGNPHHEPRARASAPIRKGDLLLLDLWCREEAAGSIWADITWMAYVGAKVPARFRDIWEIVAGARDAAVAYLRDSVALGKKVRGADVDDVARRHIQERGHGEHFLHRTGHSIGLEVHGNGCNIDGLETVDQRQLIPRTGFSIEPGIYLPEFGVRSEIDVYMDEGGVEVTTTVQDRIVPLLP